MDTSENVTVDSMNPLNSYQNDNPPIICLCGSTKFKDYFLLANRLLTLEGFIVLMPGVFGHSGDETTPEQKIDLDNLHRQKIKMSDIIFIINPGHYIGESTKKEIELAESLEIPIIYLEE